MPVIDPMNFSPLQMAQSGQKKTSAVDGFFEVLQGQISETDRLSKHAADLSRKAALGNADVSLPEAQIAAARADLQMRLMLQMRNKAVEVYKEVMSMQV